MSLSLYVSVYLPLCICHQLQTNLNYFNLLFFCALRYANNFHPLQPLKSLQHFNRCTCVLCVCREEIGSPWADVNMVLDSQKGAAWKLVFKMISRGRLYDDDKENQISITGRRLVANSPILFEEFSDYADSDSEEYDEYIPFKD